jgi:hypothetical protein
MDMTTFKRTFDSQEVSNTVVPFKRDKFSPSAIEAKRRSLEALFLSVGPAYTAIKAMEAAPKQPKTADTITRQLISNFSQAQ